MALTNSSGDVFNKDSIRQQLGQIQTNQNISSQALSAWQAGMVTSSIGLGEMTINGTAIVNGAVSGSTTYNRQTGDFEVLFFDKDGMLIVGLDTKVNSLFDDLKKNVLSGTMSRGLKSFFKDLQTV